MLPLLKIGYRIAARLGASPAQRAVAVRLAFAAIAVVALLGLFMAEAASPA